MIIGVGTDIVEKSRIKKACENPHFVQRYYTDAECALMKQRECRAASNFAAKEAVAKALGTGFRGFEPKEIEVLRDEIGKPYVVLHGDAKRVAGQLGVANIHVSISDTDSNTVAFAVAEGERS